MAEEHFPICAICKKVMDKDTRMFDDVISAGVHIACFNKKNKIQTPSYTDIAIETLRQQFPHGHPAFIELTMDELELHNDKNYDYAKDGDPLGNFNRVANIIGMYKGFPTDSAVGIALIDMLKQLDAAFYMLAKGYEGKFESVDTRLRDCHVYIKIARCAIRDKHERNNSNKT